jgi:hypothetical protein
LSHCEDARRDWRQRRCWAHESRHSVSSAGRPIAKTRETRFHWVGRMEAAAVPTPLSRAARQRPCRPCGACAPRRIGDMSFGPPYRAHRGSGLPACRRAPTPPVRRSSAPAVPPRAGSSFPPERAAAQRLDLGPGEADVVRVPCRRARRALPGPDSAGAVRARQQSRSTARRAHHSRSAMGVKRLQAAGSHVRFLKARSTFPKGAAAAIGGNLAIAISFANETCSPKLYESSSRSTMQRAFRSRRRRPGRRSSATRTACRLVSIGSSSAEPEASVRSRRSF